MEPTSTQPTTGYTGSTSPSYSSDASSAATGTDSQFSTTAAHATGTGHFPADYAAPTQPASGAKGKLNDALASGKKWLSDSGVADKAQQLPQAAKDLGNKALQSVNGLTTTQKAVGVGLLAAGVAFLATRGKKNKSDDGEYRHKARRSPFDHQPHTRDASGFESRGQRPWGSQRYGSSPQQQGAAGRARVNSGSGYTSAPSHSNDFGGQTGASHSASSQGGYAAQAGSSQRRDQGPASGSRYDAGTSGSQNPNNLDELNSAF
jgi:hypothetical protein